MLDVWLSTNDDDVIFLFAIFGGIFLVRSTGASIKSYSIRKNRLLPMQIVVFSLAFHRALMCADVGQFFLSERKTTSTLEIGMGKMAIVLALAVWMDVAPVWSFARFKNKREMQIRKRIVIKYWIFLRHGFRLRSQFRAVRCNRLGMCQSIVVFTIASTLKDIWFVCWMRDTNFRTYSVAYVAKTYIYSLWIRRLFINDKHRRQTLCEWGKPFAEIRWRIWNRQTKSRKNWNFTTRWLITWRCCLCVEFIWYFIGSS